MKLIGVGPDRAFSMWTLSPNDARFLYHEIFETEAYALPDNVVMRERPLIVDVGANIGLFSLYAARTWPGARVLAFEPVAALVQAAVANLELHGVSGVECFPVALGSSDVDDLDFTYYPGAPSSSTFFPDRLARHRERIAMTVPRAIVDRMYKADGVKVAVRTLSSYLTQGEPVDLLKIDAVGSEIDVLNGVADEHWPNIRAVHMDVQNQNGRLQQVADVLSSKTMSVTVTQAKLAGEDNLNYVVRAFAD